jgi:hypothetical protein
MKDDQCIYVIFAKLGSAYYVFVSIFHSIGEPLRASCTTPSLESFCDSLIKEKDKLLHLGVPSTIGTSKKDLVSQQKLKYKHPKKQHPRINKKNNCPKPSQ